MTIEIEIIREHIKQMLEARGDDVSYIGEHGDAVEPTRFYSQVIILDTDKTVVFFALTKDIFKEWRTMNEHLSAEALMENYPKKSFILVLSEQQQASMTKLTAMDKALQAATPQSALQVFYTKELLYNPSKHFLVPEHRKLSPEEGKEIMESYMIKNRAQMPIIKRDDVMARWLGLNTRDIVCITRYNETSGTYYYYRCCV